MLVVLDLTVRSHSHGEHMRRTPIIMAAIAVAAATTLGVTTLNDHDDASPSAPASGQDTPEPSDRAVLKEQVKRQKELPDAAIQELVAEVDKRAESLRKAQNDAP